MCAFEYVRERYGVPAEIGRIIVVDGKRGVIAEDMGHHIGVLFDEDDNAANIKRCHPTWEVVYLGRCPVRNPSRSQRRYRDYLHADSGLTFGEWLKERAA